MAASEHEEAFVMAIVNGQYIHTAKQREANKAYNYFKELMAEGHDEHAALFETEKAFDLGFKPVIMNKFRTLVKEKAPMQEVEERELFL